MAHSHHARALITPRTRGVDCTAPRSPVSHQRGPITPCPALTVRLLRISTIQLAPSCCLCGLVFLVMRTDDSPHLSFGEPPRAPRIFPVLHSVLTLFSITLLVNLCVHCAVHLAQDRFLHRSSGRLKLGKAAKDVAPVPGSESKCCAPTKRCGTAQYFGQRERRRHKSPKRKLHNRQPECTKCLCVTRVLTALTLCLSMPSRNNPFLDSFAFALDSETHKTNERLTINRSTQRRLQDSATAFIYNEI